MHTSRSLVVLRMEHYLIDSVRVVAGITVRTTVWVANVATTIPELIPAREITVG
jgi:hypothetical protein